MIIPDTIPNIIVSHCGYMHVYGLFFSGVH